MDPRLARSEQTRIGLTIFNSTSELQSLIAKLLRPNESEYQETHVFTAVPPTTDTDRKNFTQNNIN